jgi:hypothetical protein
MCANLADWLIALVFELLYTWCFCTRCCKLSCQKRLWHCLLSFPVDYSHAGLFALCQEDWLAIDSA